MWLSGIKLHALAWIYGTEKVRQIHNLFGFTILQHDADLTVLLSEDGDVMKEQAEGGNDSAGAGAEESNLQPQVRKELK